MAVNLVATFEAQAAKQAAGYETLRAQGMVLDLNRWLGSPTGVNMAGEYNAGGMGPDDTPLGGQITQNHMNNFINAIKLINKLLNGTLVEDDLPGVVAIPGAIAGVAQYDLGALDNS